MTMRRVLALLPFALAGCASLPSKPPAPIEVGILAINDFHGNLQPPHLAIQAPGGTVAVPAGGAAYLASAIATLRRGHPASITVSAGDMTGASPLASSLFLDEPTVAAMNAIGLDLNAAGNHEFDRGAKELLRLQNGGCDRNATAAPCQLDRFPGARFRYLAGNTITADGTPLLPATAIRRFGTGARAVTIGFIGLTTRTTGGLTNPVGIPGITFADEAETANRLVPALRRAGADTIVLLIHEGGYPKPETDPNACDGLSGPIVDIAARLDPAIQVVVSGHTHKAYVCPSVGGRPLLLTSAGKYGTLVTDISLRFDPVSKHLIGSGARNVIVQGEGFDAVATTDAAPRFAADPAVAAIVDRYVAAAGPLADRPVGTIAQAPVTKTNPDKSYESRLGNLVADAQLAATTAAGAQIAFMNPGGLRTDLNAAADGRVRYADIYAVQPFGNWLVVRELTGAQIRAILESQFDRGDTPLVLSVAGMTYAFDRSRPAGRHVLAPLVQGRPLDDTARYRIAISNFLAGGGDAFPGFTAGREVSAGMIDVDALAAYFRDRPALMPPAADRITDRTPAGWGVPAAR